MTRSSDEALDEAQLALGTKCERLLSSKAWHKAHTTTQKGLLRRLQMLKAAGLPAMRLVSNSKLKALGRIPRSHEGHQVDAIEAVTKCGADVNNDPLAVLLLCAAAHSNPPTTTCSFSTAHEAPPSSPHAASYSHRWKRPNWCETLQKDVPWSDPERQRAMGEGHTFGDPDDAEHSKARALIEYAAWFKRKAQASVGQNIPGISVNANIEIFWWIDWACTDQDNPGPDMAALPAYAAVCAGMVAAWSDEYAGRAWVRRHSPHCSGPHTHAQRRKPC